MKYCDEIRSISNDFSELSSEEFAELFSEELNGMEVA